MRRFYTARTLIFCVLSIVWLPALAATELVGTSPLTNLSVFYRNELIVGASVAMLILGSAVTAAWNPPIDIDIRDRLTHGGVKFALGLGGGFSAFLYVLEQQNQLTVLHPVWVLGVSFVTPIAIQVAFPSIISKGIAILDAWYSQGRK